MKFKERVDFIKKKKRSGRIDKLALDCIEWAWVEKERRNRRSVNQGVLSWDPRDKGWRALFKFSPIFTCQPVINFKPLEFDILVRLTEIDHERGYIDLA